MDVPDKLLDDNELDAFVYNMMVKYKKKLKSLRIDKREDTNGLRYLDLVGIIINDKFRGQGVGKEVMLDVIDYADNKDMPVKLWATDVFGANLKRLVDFYKSFGFKLTDKNNNMIYTPQKK